ncbi:hypothetical protein ACQP3D_28235, partial [Escherichia coli]
GEYSVWPYHITNTGRNTHGQIETNICSMSDALNAKIAKNRDRIGDLAQAVCSMSEESTTTDQKLESRIGYLEGN